MATTTEKPARPTTREGRAAKTAHEYHTTGVAWTPLHAGEDYVQEWRCAGCGHLTTSERPDRRACPSFTGKPGL